MKRGVHFRNGETVKVLADDGQYHECVVVLPTRPVQPGEEFNLYLRLADD